VRRPLIAAGVLVMTYAVGGALFDGDVNKAGVPLFLVALIVLHDGVFLPLVLGVGTLIARFVPARWQSAAKPAALISLAVTVVALPLALGFGRSADNPSALPRAYGRGPLLILLLVWVVTLAARKHFERRRVRRPGRDHG
jgi:hypothetical protein